MFMNRCRNYTECGNDQQARVRINDSKTIELCLDCFTRHKTDPDFIKTVLDLKWW